MNKALLLSLAAAWLAFALSGYVVGYVVDYVNGSSETYFFLMLDNGSLIPLAKPPPAHLVGTGERVEAELVYTEKAAEAMVSAPREPTQAIPSRPVSGSLLVTLVAAKFAGVSAEPYNMSYVHDVVFGPFPSMRHFWESASGGAVVIRPYYIHWGWVSLPRTKADYCNTGDAFKYIATDVINILYSRGIKLPSYSYLVVVLNDVPPCNSEAAGQGTVSFWSFNATYGTIWLAVSQIYHYNDSLKNNPDVRFLPTSSAIIWDWITRARRFSAGMNMTTTGMLWAALGCGGISALGSARRTMACRAGWLCRISTSWGGAPLPALAWGRGSWGRGAAFMFQPQTASTRWSINVKASTSSI